jgi:hypothetical protein
MGFEPALYPNVPAFGLPDFSQFEGAATTGTLKRIVAETLFDALAPFHALVGGGEGFQIEEGELKAESIESCADEVSLAASRPLG